MITSLYQFGFKCSSTENDSRSSTDKEVPRCMPSLEEAKALGLAMGEVEYKSITSYEFSGLSFPVNPFQVNVSFLYPLKISANKWFSDVLRRHRKVT